MASGRCYPREPASPRGREFGFVCVVVIEHRTNAFYWSSFKFGRDLFRRCALLRNVGNVLGRKAVLSNSRATAQLVRIDPHDRTASPELLLAHTVFILAGLHHLAMAASPPGNTPRNGGSSCPASVFASGRQNFASFDRHMVGP
jgi:hypothetical protein